MFFEIIGNIRQVRVQRERHYYHAIVVAGREAQQRNISIIEPYLLMYGALRSATHLRMRIVDSDFNWVNLISKVSSEIEMNVLPKYYDPLAQVIMGPDAKSTLRTVHNIIAEYKSDYPKVEHLLYALIQHKEIANLSAEYGLTEKCLLPIMTPF